MTLARIHFTGSAHNRRKKTGRQKRLGSYSFFSHLQREYFSSGIVANLRECIATVVGNKMKLFQKDSLVQLQSFWVMLVVDGRTEEDVFLTSGVSCCLCVSFDFKKIE